MDEFNTITYTDVLPDGKTFDDVRKQLHNYDFAGKIKMEYTPEMLEAIKQLLQSDSASQQNNKSFTMGRAFEALDTLTEETHRQVLVKDLIYSSVEEFLAKQEVITNITKISNEKMLQAFSDAGYIDGADMIRFPKGTVFTYKDSRDYKGDTYDIFYVKGNRFCLVAINVRNIVELFGK